MDWEEEDSPAVTPGLSTISKSSVSPREKETTKVPEANSPAPEPTPVEVPLVLAPPESVALPEVSGATEAVTVDDRSLLRRLEQDLSPFEIDFLTTEQRVSGVPVERLLEMKRILSPDKVLALVSEFFQIPQAARLVPDLEILQKNILFFMTNNLLPLSASEFVMASPRDLKILEKKLREKGFAKPRFKVARSRSIAKALRGAIMALRERPSAFHANLRGLLEHGRFATVVEEILAYAYRIYASDVHFERFKTHGTIRARVDGVLEEIVPLSPDHYDRIITAMYQLVKSQQPSAKESSDGAWSVEGLPLQIRASFYPSLNGTHNTVLRLLATSSDMVSGEDLGYSSEMWGGILRTVRQSASGLILFVGPTGSGKNSSLFSLISTLDTRGKKLLEVADPIEYQHMLGAQAQLVDTDKLQWKYADALRSALRHDPDMIFVGEIRDDESARIALDAARTGHLIFSTVHAETSFEAFDRLADLKCSMPYLLGSVKLIVAQRLLRRLCKNCAGRSCPHCLGGYSGRFALSEVLHMTDSLRETLNGELPVTAQKRTEIAKKHVPGYRTLRESAQQAIDEGLTNKEEVARVLGTEKGETS